jgi:hypothetical protein
MPKGVRPPAAGKGRPKGSVNKKTAEAKDAIAKAFEGIGGQKAFEAWAKANPDTYYATIFPKLLPVQVKHGNDDDGPFKTVTSIALVGPS